MSLIEEGVIARPSASLKEAAHRGPRHEVALLVGEAHRGFTSRQFAAIQRHIDHRVLDIIADGRSCSASVAWLPP